jgi:hypothetical protein
VVNDRYSVTPNCLPPYSLAVALLIWIVLVYGNVMPLKDAKSYSGALQLPSLCQVAVVYFILYFGAKSRKFWLPVCG